MSLASIREAAVQLVARHNDFSSMLSEVASGNTNSVCPHGRDSSNDDCANTVEGLVNHIKRQASLGTGHCDVIAASFCVTKMKEKLQEWEGKKAVFLHQNARESILVLVEVMKVLLEENSFSKNVFVKMINSDIQKLQLELLWLLHVNDIMTLDAYVTSNLGRPACIGRLSHELVSLCCPDPEGEDSKEKRSRLLNGFMLYFVHQGYIERVDNDNPASKGMKKVACALLDSITKKMLQKSGNKDLNVYTGLVKGPVSSDYCEAVKKYCSRQLTILLSISPDLKVADAFMQQKKWTFAKTETHLTRMYRDVLTPFTAEEAVLLLRRVLEQQEVNWSAVLSFTAALLVLYDETSALIEDLTKSLIRTALEACEMDGLVTGFLLARQASLEGPHVFPSYHAWFQGLFGDGSQSLANSRKSFAFLMKFLSNIVPYDSAEYLTSHIAKPVYVPPKCRPLLTDYISLAKTRLLDLGQPFDEQGIFENKGIQVKDPSTSGADNVVMHQVERDVERAVSNFGKTGKLPASIMEASIFRKPYFIGKFLPSLLRPRVLPDIPDTRMALIEQLRKAEKIPATLCAKYESECQRMTTQLLDGAFSDNEDDAMDDLLRSPWQQYEKSLEAFTRAVLGKASGEQDEGSLKSHISIIWDKLDNFLQTESPHCIDIDVPLCVDVFHTKLDDNTVKAVDAVLATVYSIADGLSTSPLPYDQWLATIMSILTKKTSQISIAFHVRMYQILCEKIGELKESEMRSLAVLCCHLNSPEVSNAVVPPLTSEDSPSRISDFIFRRMECWDRDNMVICLRFWTSCLEHVISVMDGTDVTAMHRYVTPDVPRSLVIRFDWLMRRFRFAYNHGSFFIARLGDSFITNPFKVFNCKEFSCLKKAKTITLEEWVELELEVVQDLDILHSYQRQEFYREVMQEFLYTAEEEGGCGGNVPQLCTSLVNAIAHANLRQRRQKHQLCSACGQNHSSVTSQCGNLADMTLLLQYFVNFLPSCADVPWLVSILNPGPETSQSGSAKRVGDTELVLELTNCLSPHLYLANTLQPSERVPVQQVATVMKTVWREHCTEGCTLKLRYAAHVLHGLILMQHVQHDLDSLLAQTPLLHCSLQYHWQDLKNQVKGHRLIGRLRDILREFDVIHSQCERICSGEGSAVSCGEDKDHLYGAAVLSVVCRGSGAEVDAEALLAWLRGRAVVTKWLAHFIVSRAAYGLLIGQSTHAVRSEMLCKIFMQQPTAFVNSRDQSGSIAQTMCPDYVTKLQSVVILKHLKSCAHVMTQRLCQSADCLSCLLQIHQHYIALYSEGMEQSQSPHMADLCSSQPCGLPEVIDVTEFVKSCVRMAPSNVKCHVNQAVIEQCDPDVKLCFHMR